MDDAGLYMTRYIGKIKNYDVTNSTDMYNTLRISVNNLWNYSQTAKVLFINHNTVKYRLKQIGKIVGLDFAEQNDRLIIEISLKLYELLSKD